MRHGEPRLIADSDPNEREITCAAVAGYARLRRTVGGRFETYPAGDGGLICEKRKGRARSTLWRVAPDGTVISDTPYSYAQHTFVPAPPVSGLAAVPEPVATDQDPGRRVYQRGA